MNQISRPIADRLPPPPAFSDAVLPVLPEDMIGPLRQLMLLAEALAERLEAADRYNRRLKARLRAMCREVESAAPTPDDLTPAIEDLLEFERRRAALRAPLRAQIDEYRKQAQKLFGIVPYLVAKFNQITERAERVSATELEALRDARLRIELRRAALLNRGAPPSPTFDSGDAAIAFLRSLHP